MRVLNVITWLPSFVWAHIALFCHKHSDWRKRWLSWLPRPAWPSFRTTKIVVIVVVNISLSVWRAILHKDKQLREEEEEYSWMQNASICGQLCEPHGPYQYDTVAGIRTEEEGRFFPKATIPINCTGAFTITDPRFSRQWKAYLMALSDALTLSHHTFNPLKWTDQQVRASIKLYQANEGNTTCPHWGDVRLHSALLAVSLRGKRVVVYGSRVPTLEAHVLRLGAAHVDSVLPIPHIRNPHPKLRLLTASDWQEQYLGNRWLPYDVAVVGPRLSPYGVASVRSGVYPHGDVIDVAKLWCMTKPSGRMVMQLPTGPEAEARWTSLTANWDQLQLVRAPQGGPVYGIFNRTGRNMTEEWFLLQQNFHFERIGNLMWATASAIALARAMGYEPRARAHSSYVKLQALFPALELKLVSPKTHLEDYVHETDSCGMRYNPEFLEIPPNSAIEGFLQSWKYLGPQDHVIRRMFRFKSEVEEQAKGFIAEARRQRHASGEAMLVAVHVRRGDLRVKSEHLVPDDFWLRAIRHLQEKHPSRQMVFIVMAGGNEDRGDDRNDYDFAQKWIPVPFVPTPIQHTPQVDLAIMAYSDAVVISSGSFGFWGAYLNNKICVAPDCALSVTYRSFVAADYYPPWCERLHCKNNTRHHRPAMP